MSPLTAKPYTARQALAFIYYYTEIRRQPPAEADAARYFRISPPSAHQTAATLEGKGPIERAPGRARSTRLLLTRGGIPDLE